MHWIVIGEIFGLFILPLILIYLRIVPFVLRLPIFSFVVAIIGAIVFVQKWSLEQLGLATPLNWANIAPYLLFTLLGVGLILFVAFSKHRKAPKCWWKHPRVFYFPLLSISQEFIFRVFLIELLFSVSSSPIFVVLISAAVFAAAHLIFAVKTYEMIMIFSWGLALGFLYVLIPSFILVAAVHIIFNFFIVVYGNAFTKQVYHRKLKIA